LRFFREFVWRVRQLAGQSQVCSRQVYTHALQGSLGGSIGLLGVLATFRGGAYSQIRISYALLELAKSAALRCIDVRLPSWLCSLQHMPKDGDIMVNGRIEIDRAVASSR
jgi:hypothetical protein